jgi:hypothetical protein
LLLVEDSSGMRHGYDRLSKSGRPLLRRLPVEASRETAFEKTLDRAGLFRSLQRGPGDPVEAWLARPRMRHLVALAGFQT